MGRIILTGMVLMICGLTAQVRGDESNQPAALAANQFSADLYGHLPAEGNLFCSPLSIYSAMMMTSAGARGETAAEMLATLHATQGDAHATAGQLMTALEAPNQDFQLHIANALWARDGFKCLPEFQNLLMTDYRCGFFGVDFSKPDVASRRINDWVAEQTAGKIPELFSPGTLPPATRLVLTNAIYFHADWESPFEAEKSAPAEFYVPGQANFFKPMTMNQHGSFPLMRGDQFDTLELPYKGGKMCMLIVLPHVRDGLKAVTAQLSADFLNRIVAGLKPEFVEVSIPKFSFTQQFSLPETLKAMGISKAFESGEADFSGMDGSRDLFLSNVVHKAYVAVDEKGTEAAAATGAVMMPTAVPMPQAVFRADHPFFFVILDRSSGAILFMGRVWNPQTK